MISGSGSEKPSGESYTLARQADLVSGFINKLGLKSLSLAGHSYGGGICLILVGQLSSSSHFSADSLILVDTICYQQEFPGFIKYLQMPIIRWFALNLIPARTLARLTLGLCYASKDKVTDESVTELSSALKSEGAEESLIATAEKIIPEEMDSFISSYKIIRIPTFILWGAKDNIVPLKLGERLHSEIPSSTMVILDDCGHIPQEEFPEETAKLLIDFLSGERHDHIDLARRATEETINRRKK